MIKQSCEDSFRKVCLWLAMAICIAFYGLKNPIFIKLTELDPSRLFLLLAVVFTYFFSTLLPGRLLKQREHLIRVGIINMRSFSNCSDIIRDRRRVRRW